MKIQDSEKNDESESSEVMSQNAKKVGKKKKSISELLTRLNEKELRDLHTNAFDVPRTIVTKLRKRIGSWQEEEIVPKKRSKKDKVRDKNHSVVSVVPDKDIVVDTGISIASTSKSLLVSKSGTDIASGSVRGQRSNFLKLDYPTTRVSLKSIENDPKKQSQMKQKLAECHRSAGDEQDNGTLSKSQDVANDSLWRSKSIYTDILHSYFTLENQTELPSTVDLTQLDTPAPILKSKSLKYRCKICEESGIKSGSRATGVVTCPYGNNSNMKRHIETVSQLL